MKRIYTLIMLCAVLCGATAQTIDFTSQRAGCAYASDYDQTLDGTYYHYMLLTLYQDMNTARPQLQFHFGVLDTMRLDDESTILLQVVYYNAEGNGWAIDQKSGGSINQLSFNFVQYQPEADGGMAEYSIQYDLTFPNGQTMAGSYQGSVRFYHYGNPQQTYIPSGEGPLDPEGIEQISEEALPKKIWRNGQVFILRGNECYDLCGRRVA